MTDTPPPANPMDDPYLQPLAQYIAQLSEESARGSVLISTGFLEEQLKNILMSFFVQDANPKDLVEGANVPLGSFSSRVAACYALALISQIERDDLTTLRKVRNEFAHRMDASFENRSIIDRCRNLHHRARDREDTGHGPVVLDARIQFQTAAAGLIINLYNRAQRVEAIRRTVTEYEP